MSLIEGTGEQTVKPQGSSRIQKQELLMSKLNTIFMNKTMSNKEKIAEMNTLFLDDIHPFHIELAKELVEQSAEESFEECYSNELKDKYDRYGQII